MSEEKKGVASRETFGQQIQTLRRERGLTQRQVAERLDVDVTYLSRLENDRGDAPSEELVTNLAGVLETDREELLALAGKVPKDLRARAQGDVEFARFLRRLPNLEEGQLRKVYRAAKPASRDQ